MEIAEADAVVFIGYRFPASDAQARDEILGALRVNKRKHADSDVQYPRTFASCAANATGSCVGRSHLPCSQT
jgi:hypothetical protein